MRYIIGRRAFAFAKKQLRQKPLLTRLLAPHTNPSSVYTCGQETADGATVASSCGYKVRWVVLRPETNGLCKRK